MACIIYHCESKKMNEIDLEKFRAITLPEEDEIRENWQCSNMLVSVVCFSYNHISYIEDAIRGFLIQKTNVAFEILMHDDASTDGTQDIIKHYIKKYPNIIKAHFQIQNQYSRNVKILLLGASLVSGDFIAFCEGDDFWISENKLQMQIDALLEYDKTEICFHPAYKLVNDIIESDLFCRRAENRKLFEIGPIIRGGGSFMPTASMLIRRSFFERISKNDFDFFKRNMMGYCTQIFCTEIGGALYLDKPMSIYRVMADGSWTKSILKDQGFYVAWLNSYLEFLREADTRLQYKFSKEFNEVKWRCHMSVLSNANLSINFRNQHYLNNKNEIGFFGFLIWKIIKNFPWVQNFKRSFNQLLRR